MLIVGQQTSGKSALIEALMGFQFNQVRGTGRQAGRQIRRAGTAMSSIICLAARRRRQRACPIAITPGPDTCPLCLSLQVGGGTKTRRPIALRMQYNPRCSQPHCFLTLDNGKEEARSLKEIQVSNYPSTLDREHCRTPWARRESE